MLDRKYPMLDHKNPRSYDVGFTCSTFDLLHAGHILMLEEAKATCEHLIVGLQTDPSIDRPNKNKPVQSIVERYVQLKAVKYVDEIMIYTTEQDLIDLIQIIHPNVRILGEEYKDQNFTGKEVCEQMDIDIVYNSRTHRFSSSELRNRVAQIQRPYVEGKWSEP